MSVQSLDWDRSPRRDSLSTLVFRQCHRGQAVSETRSARNIEFLELSTKVLGITLPIAGGGLFLLGPTAGLEWLWARAAAFALLVALGWVTYSFGAKGLINELAIDEGHRKIRVSSIDSGGNVVSTKSYALDNVLSVFIRRSRKSDSVVTLNIRIKGVPGHVIILRGPETVLRRVLDHIVEMHTANTSIRNRPQTKTTGQFIAAEFV